MSMQQQYVSEDEISLVDLWNTLVERKWMVLGVWGAILGGGVLYALLQPSEYQWRTVVGVGVVDGSAVESTEDVVVRLQDEVVRADMAVEVSSSRRSSRVVLESVAPLEKADTVVAWHEGLVAGLLEEHGARFERQRRQLEAELAMLAEAQEQMQRTEAMLSEQIEQQRSASDDGDPMGSLLLHLLLDRLAANQTQQHELMQAHGQQNLRLELARPTEVVQSVQRSTGPVAPKRELIIVLSFVLGAMLGMFAAFFANFLRAARQQRGAL